MRKCFKYYFWQHQAHLCTVDYSTLQQSWASIPGFAFPHSWHFRNAGKFCTGTQVLGMRKNRNANFAFLWRKTEHFAFAWPQIANKERVWARGWSTVKLMTLNIYFIKKIYKVKGLNELTIRRRNAKQESGNAKEMLIYVGTRNAKAKSRNACTRDTKRFRNARPSQHYSSFDQLYVCTLRHFNLS